MNLKLFRSVKFNTVLVFILALAASAGTFLPQLSEAPEKVDLFLRAHPYWGKLLQQMGFFNVYRSWWFIALLALMSFDIVVCKLWSKPPDAGLVNLPPELEKQESEGHLVNLEKAVRLKPLHEQFETEAAPGKAAKRIQSYLARQGYHLHAAVGEPSGRFSFVATKHRAQRWGSYLAHVSLVVILGGGLVKLLFGFEEMVPVMEGGSGEVRHKPGWHIHVDKFTVEYYEETSDPKLFASRLRVTDGNREIGSKRITVNDPLEVGGVRFYQASWGAGGMFRSATLDLGGKLLSISQRKPILLPGTPIRVLADVMLPNFMISGDGTADTASLEPRNPAVKVHFEMSGRKTPPLWLLQNVPNIAFAEGPDGILSHAPEPPFTLASIDPVLFSGIQVGYDPGYPLVVGGAIAWLVGNVLLFYMHRRRLWVSVHASETGAHARVAVGAWSSRGAPGFRQEFEGMMARIKKNLGEAEV